MGFVLAGGRSSRMGADKALLALGGRPLIAHALATLRAAGLTASIAGARADVRAALTGFAPVVEDGEPDKGPLGGICAALAATAAELSVFLPVDLPLLPAVLVALLLRDAQTTGAPVTLVSVNGFAQTFPAVVGQAALAALRNELEAGRAGCFAAFQAAAAQLCQPLRVLPVEYLVQAGQMVDAVGMPAALWFLNVNAPEELELAERLQPGWGFTFPAAEAVPRVR